MAEVWVCFSCCMSTSAPASRKKPRRKIDRSMIGSPANFQHLNHIGSGESGGATVQVQENMQSKGGYEYCTEVKVERSLKDVANQDDVS